LQNAYGVKKATKTDGSGNLVAVVDAYDDPNAEADLATFRSANKLPVCTTANGCFEKVNQVGQQTNYPSPDAGWASEISLDLQMVSSICPLCHILLVEANSSGFGDLGAAENEAVALGAHVISNSWGNGEFNGETGYDSYWDHPGVDITFSSGDGAYQGGVQYPTASPFVTSVGGTQLKPASNSRGLSEKALLSV
jgi:subtilase family serine protease